MHRIDKGDGSFFILERIPAARRAIALAYHHELSTALRALNVPFWEADADTQIYPQLHPYYQALANQLRPVFLAEDLTPDSRHRLFISRGLEAGGSLPIPSIVEELLGLDYRKPAQAKKKSSIPEAILTTGDEELDLATMVARRFGASAEWVMNTYSADQVDKMIVFCSELDRGREALREKQEQLDREWFKQNEERIMAESIALGFTSVASLDDVTPS